MSGLLLPKKRPKRRRSVGQRPFCLCFADPRFTCGCGDHPISISVPVPSAVRTPWDGCWPWENVAPNVWKCTSKIAPCTPPVSLGMSAINPQCIWGTKIAVADWGPGPGLCHISENGRPMSPCCGEDLGPNITALLGTGMRGHAVDK